MGIYMKNDDLNIKKPIFITRRVTLFLHMKALLVIFSFLQIERSNDFNTLLIATKQITKLRPNKESFRFSKRSKNSFRIGSKKWEDLEAHPFRGKNAFFIRGNDPNG